MLFEKDSCILVCGNTSFSIWNISGIYKKCSSGGEAVVRKNNGSYTVGFWYTQGFLDSGFSLFAYSNDDSRTDVIQMVKEYGGIEYEINLSEKEKGWYYVTAKVGE